MAHQITCGHCSRSHADVATVKACSAGNVSPCHWLVERYEGWTDEETGQAEYWPVTVDCGADATFTDRGWTCTAGHEHVNAETRWAERWDYAEDEGEALNLVRAGVQPYTMDGHLATSPADFAPSYALAGA